MQHIDNHTARSAMIQLAGILEDLAAGCDPEFDAVYDELDREFAELRCRLGNA